MRAYSKTHLTTNVDSIFLSSFDPIITLLESFIPSCLVAGKPVVTSASPPFDLLSFDASLRPEHSRFVLRTDLVLPCVTFVVAYHRHLFPHHFPPYFHHLSTPLSFPSFAACLPVYLLN
jgi:hypothetical protein